jgi:hypothetical protein
MARKSKNVADAPIPENVADAPDKLAIVQRLSRLGVWTQISSLRDQMMREARDSGMTKEQAQHWVYSELDRLYPAHAEVKTQDQSQILTTQGLEEDEDGKGGARTELSTADAVVARAREIAARGRVIGLDALPDSWPALPAAGMLAAELSWVQSNRLSIVSEPPNGAVKVDLSRAAEPAPSRSALAWLETSIRNYSKYTDVLARVASNATDEAETTRRERVQLSEIERLLDQMASTV